MFRVPFWRIVRTSKGSAHLTASAASKHNACRLPWLQQFPRNAAGASTWDTGTTGRLIRRSGPAARRSAYSMCRTPAKCSTVVKCCYVPVCQSEQDAGRSARINVRLDGIIPLGVCTDAVTYRYEGADPNQCDPTFATCLCVSV